MIPDPIKLCPEKKPRTQTLLDDARGMAARGLGWEDAYTNLLGRGLLSLKDKPYFRQLFLSVARGCK